MTPRQIDLLRGSFAVLARNRERTITIYFDRLGRIGWPRLGRLEAIPEAIGEGLMKRLAFLVDRADRLDALAPALGRWGRRFRAAEAGYGLDALGAAWLLTMEGILGPAWTAELEGAWVDFYGLVLDQLRADA